MNPRTSIMTAEEILSWAEGKVTDSMGNGWPRARWRVEGGAAGNSVLLTLKAARKTIVKHGGKIVQMLPAWKEYEEHCSSLGREPVNLRTVK